MRALLATIALAALTLSACTDADLVGFSKETVFERNEVIGQVCAPPYLTLDVPYRVLFVIDTSLSNEWNDPTKRRVDAVRNAINANLPRPNVSFGIISFSDTPRVQTLAFTRDPQVLAGAINHLSIPQGATNYADTLWTVKTFILEDLNAQPALEAARVHYLVFFLSDGFPTVGTTDPASIVPMVSTLRSLIVDRVAELRIDTAFLGARVSNATEAAEAAAAQALLTDMAAAGGGRFSNIPQGQAFSFEIDPTPMRALFQLEGLVVANRSLVQGPTGPLPDSDGDGLDDLTEEEAGLDPLSIDTDGDGFRDGVEWFSSGRLDPLLPNGPCEKTGDRDGDGLLDCEELVLGTLPGNPDSDGDRLPDELELLSGASPVDDRSTLDRDEDGLPDQEEVRAHLQAQRFDEPAAIKDWSYTYAVRAVPRTSVDEPGCFAVQVGNVPLVETQETAERPRGVNTIDVYAVFALQGGVEPRWERVRLQGRFLRDPYVLVPVTNVFELEPAQLEQLPR